MLTIKAEYVTLPGRLESDQKYAVLGYIRVYNYSNKNAAVSVLTIVTGVCLAMAIWSVARLLGRKTVMSNYGRQNDAGNNPRKKIDCKVIEK